MAPETETYEFRARLPDGMTPPRQGADPGVLEVAADYIVGLTEEDLAAKGLRWPEEKPVAFGMMPRSRYWFCMDGDDILLTARVERIPAAVKESVSRETDESVGN